MGLDVSADAGSEQVRQDVEKAVRVGLGDRVERGNWVVTLRRLPHRAGYVVDLSNLDGFMRQWVFAAGDPLADVIRHDLQAA